MTDSEKIEKIKEILKEANEADEDKGIDPYYLMDDIERVLEG